MFTHTCTCVGQRSSGFRISHLTLAQLLPGPCILAPGSHICKSWTRVDCSRDPFHCWLCFLYFWCLKICMEGENYLNKSNHVAAEFLDRWKVRRLYKMNSKPPPFAGLLPFNSHWKRSSGSQFCVTGSRLLNALYGSFVECDQTKN